MLSKMADYVSVLLDLSGLTENVVKVFGLF